MYNLVGYMAIWISKGSDISSYVKLIGVAAMGKEACLFFAFVYFAMTVNDAANDVNTEVYLWPTSGEEDGDADRRRRKLEILTQGRSYVGPKKRKNRGTSWRRVVAHEAGGIRFDVLGIRWTTKKTLALALSVVLSFLGAYVQPKNQVSPP